MMKQVLHDFVGILAPLVLVLVLILTVIHFCQNYKAIDTTIVIISKFALVCIILSLICVILTYFKPYLMNNICVCQLLWKLSLICFITGIYCIKFMYIRRVHIYFKGPSSDGNFTGVIPKSVYFLIVSTIISYCVSITLQFIAAFGECYKNRNIFGCNNGFHNSNIYIGLLMIVIDIALFYWYSKTWNDKINLIIKHSCQSVKIQNNKILSAFRTQLILTTFALFITSIDAIIHLIFQEYFAINAYIIDNFMVCIFYTI